mmetsp:Transcript_8060/g.26536  ORF Transcript_8060/g.26536 Transcript_8060/m.26536 type:complete len:379 (-) Transcript_8060:152-1288(-)
MLAATPSSRLPSCSRRRRSGSRTSTWPFPPRTTSSSSRRSLAPPSPSKISRASRSERATPPRSTPPPAARRLPARARSAARARVGPSGSRRRPTRATRCTCKRSRSGRRGRRRTFSGATSSRCPSRSRDGRCQTSTSPRSRRSGSTRAAGHLAPTRGSDSTRPRSKRRFSRRACVRWGRAPPARTAFTTPTPPTTSTQSRWARPRCGLRRLWPRNRGTARVGERPCTTEAVPNLRLRSRLRRAAKTCGWRGVWSSTRPTRARPSGTARARRWRVPRGGGTRCRRTSATLRLPTLARRCSSSQKSRCWQRGASARKAPSARGQTSSRWTTQSSASASSRATRWRSRRGTWAHSTTNPRRRRSRACTPARTPSRVGATCR